MQFDYIAISFLISISYAKAFFNGSQIHNCSHILCCSLKKQCVSDAFSQVLPGSQCPGQAPDRLPCPGSAVTGEAFLVHLYVLSCPEVKT